MKNYGIILCSTLLVCACVVTAAPITIVNASFESAVDLFDGPGWEGDVADTGFGVWKTTSTQPDGTPTNGATDGTTVMWGPGIDEGNSPHPKSDGSLFQTTGHDLAANEAFTLTFDASAYHAGVGWTAILYYLDGNTRVPLVTATFADPDGSIRNVERYTINTAGLASGVDLSYDSGTGMWVEAAPTVWVEGTPVVSLGAAVADGIGKPLGIEFVVNTVAGKAGLHVDNVKLSSETADIPEPATLGLLALSTTALLRRKR